MAQQQGQNVMRRYVIASGADLIDRFFDLLFRKLVIIGDGAGGKTSLLSVFTLGYFPTVGTGILNEH